MGQGSDNTVPLVVVVMQAGVAWAKWLPKTANLRLEE